MSPHEWTVTQLLAVKQCRRLQVGAGVLLNVLEGQKYNLGSPVGETCKCVFKTNETPKLRAMVRITQTSTVAATTVDL